MALFDSRKIEVDFVDAETGENLASSKMPADQLPDAFTIATTMHMDGVEWTVVSADPADKADFSRTRRLRLTLGRVEMADPEALKFSYPTISNDQADLEAPDGNERSVLQLDGDGWRQIEYVDVASTQIVEDDLEKIRLIYTAADGGAFDNVHLRADLPAPLQRSRIRIGDIRALVQREVLTPVMTTDVLGNPGSVVGGFASQMPGGAIVYGAARDDEVEALCVLDPRSKLAFIQGNPGGLDLGRDTDVLLQFARRHDAILVDWCAASIIGP